MTRYTKAQLEAMVMQGVRALRDAYRPLHAQVTLSHWEITINNPNNVALVVFVNVGRGTGKNVTTDIVERRIAI